MKVIDKFKGKYSFLSNFYPSVIYLNGLKYPTVEHAFQAQKTENLAERTRFSIAPPSKTKNPIGSSPTKAKKAGHNLRLRKHWDKKRKMIMLRLVLLKFLTHAGLAKKLMSTRDAKLEEGNNWGDTFWGTVDGEGENHLGTILEGVRDILVTFVNLEHGEEE